MRSLIVTDTTSTISIKEANDAGIILIPLNIIIDNQSYLDCYEMDNNKLGDCLREKLLPTTSQPNIKLIVDELEKHHAKDYDHVYILTISSGLSGTYQSFKIAIDELKLTNVTLVDTKTVCCTIRNMVFKVCSLVNNGYSHEEIIHSIDEQIKQQYSFLYPSDLSQLKKGGRISPMAYQLASLLKIKPLLYLNDDGNSIEKYAVCKTEKKIISTIVNKIKALGMDNDQYMLYVAHSETQENAESFTNKLMLELNIQDYQIIPITSVLMCHAGFGAYAIQIIKK
ncbi:MAG: DegV family protein [Erysipelotrichaceae bacterium]|nr:DegV family protein [Erysipelotrichaceae bacterium]